MQHVAILCLIVGRRDVMILAFRMARTKCREHGTSPNHGTLKFEFNIKTENIVN